MKKLFTILLLILFLGFGQQTASFFQRTLDISSVNASVGPSAMCGDLADAKY